jgi:hypothetical protein
MPGVLFSKLDGGRIGTLADGRPGCGDDHVLE